jgi:hypothetical protein
MLLKNCLEDWIVAALMCPHFTDDLVVYTNTTLGTPDYIVPHWRMKGTRAGCPPSVT